MRNAFFFPILAPNFYYQMEITRFDKGDQQFPCVTHIVCTFRKGLGGLIAPL